MNTRFIYRGEEIEFGQRLLFVEPRCQTFSAIGVSVGIAQLGTTIGLAASGSGQPNEPNLAKSSQALSQANAELLPLQRGMTAAAQSGGSYTFSLPKGATAKEFGLVNGSLNGVPVTQNADGTYTVNFQGYGQADVQSTMADQAAKSGLALAQQYDPQFIASALQEQNEADPQSAAARTEESSLIQNQINRPLNSPVSEMLNQQVQDTLNAANNNTLTDMDTQRLNAAVASAQGARGGAGPQADFSAPLTTGFAGEQRQANAAQGAEGFLASGQDPEDIAYRREQQNLANLSAEVSGKTPQSQFGAMSAAQSGPTPMVTGGALPTLPGDQTQGADQAAIENSQTANRYSTSQINPWMQGMSGLIGLGSAAGGLGFKPTAPAS